MHVYGMISSNELMALFHNRGSAVDAYPKFYVPDYQIAEMDVPEPEDGLNLYFSEEENHRIWYTSKAEADGSGKEYYRVQIEETVRPYEEGHIFQCVLEHGEKGLFTRINNHPEQLGSMAKGKVFFVDESWSDAVPGIARVQIRKEGPNYGFIVGEMVQLAIPDAHDLAAFLRDELDGNLDYRVLERHQTATGYYVSESLDKERTCYALIDGQIQQIPDLNGKILWSKPVKDFLAQQFFQKDKNTVSQDLFRASIPDNFLCMAEEVQDIESCEDIPILNQALQCRLVRGFAAKDGVAVYTFTDRFQYLCRFSAEMIHELSEWIVKLNRKAVDQITS